MQTFQCGPGASSFLQRIPTEFDFRSDPGSRDLGDFRSGPYRTCLMVVLSFKRNEPIICTTLIDDASVNLSTVVSHVVLLFMKSEHRKTEWAYFYDQQFDRRIRPHTPNESLELMD